MYQQTSSLSMLPAQPTSSRRTTLRDLSHQLTPRLAETSYRRTAIPRYESTFYQTITGLTAGTTYQLSFWQASSQQVDFLAPPQSSGLSRWAPRDWAWTTVSNPCTYRNHGLDCKYDDIDYYETRLLEGYVAWEEVTVDLTADASDRYIELSGVG